MPTTSNVILKQLTLMIVFIECQTPVNAIATQNDLSMDKVQVFLRTKYFLFYHIVPFLIIPYLIFIYHIMESKCNLYNHLIPNVHKGFNVACFSFSSWISNTTRHRLRMPAKQNIKLLRVFVSKGEKKCLWKFNQIFKPNCFAS